VVMSAGLLPATHLLIEPGKVLFLNNAINHGVLGPLALTQSAEAGRSALFLLETNPGPGLGLLLAYWSFGHGPARATAPASVVIHFLGGIHEIYFTYVLIRPRLIVALIAGGMAATTLYVATGAGLVAMPSPGSIFAYAAMSPRRAFWPVLSGVVLATVVSFSVAAILLRFPRRAREEMDLEQARASVARLKTSAASPPLDAMPPVRKIVFACDAGMGSSAMGASILRQKLKRAGVNVAVCHAAINEIPADADLVLTHRSLTERARQQQPLAEHIGLEDFLKSPVYDELVARFRGTNSAVDGREAHAAGSSAPNA
jgi:mannitol PTS system EIICBA or EIICB component